MPRWLPPPRKRCAAAVPARPTAMTSVAAISERRLGIRRRKGRTRDESTGVSSSRYLTISQWLNRVQQGVDPERVAEAGKAFEVDAAFAFALERIAVVGVVGDQHEHVALLIENDARVRDLAVDALRGLTGVLPQADRRNLRHAFHVVEHVKDRMSRAEHRSSETRPWAAPFGSRVSKMSHACSPQKSSTQRNPPLTR